ncbi:MAG: AAA family ATPase, partial [Planctomycetia bacterium]|nr:AAA family ATPase [Planctomycetia bacterium]
MNVPSNISSSDTSGKGGGIQVRRGVSFDPVAVIHSLRRRWLPSVIVGLILSSLAVWAALQYVPARYGADAYLQVTAGSSGLLSVTSTENERSATSKEFMETQMALITSSQVAEKSLENPLISRLACFPEDDLEKVPWIQDNLQVSAVKNTNLIRLYFRSENAEDARKILEAIIGAYQTSMSDMDVTEKGVQSQKIQDAITSMESRIQTDQELLRAQAEVTQAGDPDTLELRQQLMWQELSAVRSDLRGVELKLRTVEADIQLEEAMLNSVNRENFDFGNPDFTQFLSRDPIYVNLMSLMNMYEQQGVAYERSGRSVDSPQYQFLIVEMRAIRNQMDERARSMIGEYRSVVEARVRMNIERLTITQDMYKVQQENLTGEAQRLNQQVIDLNTRSMKLKMMQAELDRNLSVLQSLQQDRDNLRLIIQANMPRIQRLYDPREIPTPDRTTMIAAAFLGAVAGMFFPFLFFVGIDFTRHRIGSAAQAKRLTGMDIVGVIPMVRNTVLMGGASEKKRKPFLQSIDIIATRLIRESERHGLRTFLITSSVFREGRTSAAFNLALSLARMGHRTVLVDADFQRSKLHRIIHCEQVPGLVEVLNGQPITDVILDAEGVDNLSFLPSGDVQQLADSELAGDSFGRVLAELRKAYDFVILDSAAVLPVVDSRLMARSVDSTLLCVMRDYSRRDEIVASVEGFATL